MGAAAQGPESWDVDTLYQRACAPCHGPDGAGLTPDDPKYETFDPLPADLTEPLFNSVEPAADWFLVIKHGGAKLGLSSQMPAYGDALSDERIDELVVHLKNLVDTSAYPPGELNYPRPFEAIKAFPESEALVIQRFESGGRGRPDALRTTLYYARRFGTRLQGEVKVVEQESQGRSELDELELGLKWAFFDDLESQLLMAVGLEAEIPIEDDVASDVAVPYFSLAKGIGDALTFQGTLKAELPVDDVDQGAVELSGALHWLRTEFPRGVTPAIEWTLAEPLSGPGETAASILPQLYIGLTKGGHVALAVGAEVPLTGHDYDYRIHTFLLWEYADGPFWAGW